MCSSALHVFCEESFCNYSLSLLKKELYTGWVTLASKKDTDAGYFPWHWWEALDWHEDFLSTWGFTWTSDLEVFGFVFSVYLFIVLVHFLVSMGDVAQRYTDWKSYMHNQENKIMTLNVKGLHNPIKRSKIIAKMKREKLQVIFWQETHLSSLEHEKLKNLVSKLPITCLINQATKEE